MHGILDGHRLVYNLRKDLATREQASQIEDLIEKIRNLEFSLENSRIRASDFEERYNQYRKEIQRVKDEAKNSYER